MIKTLYVGNISWSTTKENLQAAFEACAPVKSVRIITDKMTNRSRGFGFIEVDEADSQNVVKSMNGTELEGRALIVNEARPKVTREGGA